MSQLLKYGRPLRSDERWARRDTVAAVVLAVGAAIAFYPQGDAAAAEPAEASARRPVTELHGAAFGTTWTVKVRGDQVDAEMLKRELEAELNRVEFSLSHWRSSSATTDLNRPDSPQPFGLTP